MTTIREELEILEKGTEEQLRECKTPTPENFTQLEHIIAILETRKHDYGTCVYAMSLAATAAFNYMANKLGVTGFQASMADLDVLRRTRRIEGPFAIIKAVDQLYPQYDDKIVDIIEEWDQCGWLKEEAQRNIAEHGGSNKLQTYEYEGEEYTRPLVDPRVWERWEQYANG